MNTPHPPLWSDDPRSRKFYAAVWRWHFYAGLFVVPFLLTLAVTGMVMMISSEVSNQLGDVADIAPQGTPLPVTAQADRALAAVPGGTPDLYAAPEAPDRPAFFAIRQGDAVMSVALNPYMGQVLNVQDKTSTIYAIASGIHGKLMLGDTGDRIVESAASLTLLLIVTGLWMWLPRAGFRRAFVPDLSARGRPLLKSIHAVLGTWVSLFLLLFVLSGLSWSGVWGDRFVQPWSSFPAEKWDNVPLSDTTHASMNHSGHHDVPWGIEQTPMPASGSDAGEAAVKQPVSLDSVAAWAAANGFMGQYKVTLPKGDTGVFTLMAETRNEDSVAPWQERTLHIDRHTGNVLADIRYADYSLVAKAMAWGIGLHKGLSGTWNFVLNFVILCSVITICVTGIAMWWKRRPAGTGRLVAPPLPQDLPFWNGALMVALVLAMAFPMAGITLLVVVTLDVLVLARLPVLKRALS
jgi:uncharacterized iron-regulated membrane protein